MKVQFTPTGRSQFLSAIAYIRRDKPDAAQAFRAKAEHTLRRLEEFPESGRQIPEFPTLPYREVLISSYRLFYHVRQDIVWIVAVWHAAQLPKKPGE